jgi:heme-degrading monooxygenase HmoA
MGESAMFVIVWEFRVQREHASDFERAYCARGEWAKLFAEGVGFLSTELLHDRDDISRFVSVDRWRSRAEYDVFRARFDAEYLALDARTEKLTESEMRIGVFESPD